MHRLSVFALAMSALLLMVAHLSNAVGDDKVMAPSAAYKPAAGCAETPLDLATDLKARTPREAHYPVCVDQHAVLEAAIAEARAAKKLLLVDFGATWCPWCRELHRQLAASEVRTGAAGERDLGTLFHFTKIGVSTLNQGRQAVIPTGRAAMVGVLRKAPDFKELGVPVIVVIDPNDPNRVVPRNIDEIEVPGQTRIDPARLRTLLLAVHDSVRTGTPMPSEPGWLTRKINKLRGYL
jgi:thiol-disulfide isomerase/thioredoxin